MVDHNRLFVAVVHVAPHAELLGRVEAVERRRPLGVLHRDEPLRPVAASRAGDDAARLIGVVLAGMPHDRIVEIPGDGQHAYHHKVTIGRGPGIPVPRRATRTPRTRYASGRRKPARPTAPRSPRRRRAWYRARGAHR